MEVNGNTLIGDMEVILKKFRILIVKFHFYRLGYRLKERSKSLQGEKEGIMMKILLLFVFLAALLIAGLLYAEHLVVVHEFR